MKQVKVFLDTLPLLTGHKVRGVGSYTLNLVEALKKEKNIALVENQKEADIIHYPYFDLFFLTLPLNKEKPTVVTIHDVIPLIYPNHYPPGIKGWFKFQIQKLSLKSVSAIITDSETSKKDIVRFLDAPQEKIQVVHLAPAEEFRKLEIKKRYGLPDRFVLYVGDVNYNKNIINLIKACKLIKFPLVIVGKQAVTEDFDKEHPENQPLRQLLEDFGKDPSIVRVGFVPLEDLVKMYNLATVYCQPSFYEGFGLPVLEAMACGTPVVAAKTQSLVEIACESAFFVDPKDYRSIADGLREAIHNTTLRGELIKKGFHQVKEFSWEKTAKQTIGVYKKVLHV